MKRTTCLLFALFVAFTNTDAGDYKTRRGQAEFTVTTTTFTNGILLLNAELQPRNFTRIDRVYLVTPSGKKLKPLDKTTFAEQQVQGGAGGKTQVELATQRTAGTYLADAYLFELPEKEKKGRWFFYAQGAGARGQESGFRVEIPEKDIEAVMKGEPVPEKEK